MRTKYTFTQFSILFLISTGYRKLSECVLMCTRAYPINVNASNRYTLLLIIPLDFILKNYY